ncbi:Aminotransferase class V [Candidatus Nitrospira nitrosa]|uniref:Aminotransferase class V n=1 Tax=Candidatus Nitrospira nitrosa TaxID=1742972 RepID=A0A0S4L8N8_9BACT|nr:aminotransferase class V-fold PLP-dependent enzyme [Candidatus Nitrospira nitrosa]CUS32973.1 Aminotransferase class V [Candidatus Nitrospira nitrosa]
MTNLGRRDFLVRTGLALGAALLADARPCALANPSSPQGKFESWENIRTQFPLCPQLIHLAAFFLASHPTPVREAIERHRAGLDADPIGYWFDHEEKQEAMVLQAAAEYLGANPTDIALTDSTTMGLGLLYGGLKLGNEQEILTTTHDHYSTETALRLRAERTGAMVRQIHLYRSLKTVSRDEIVESLRKGITPMTRIVAVTWVHSSTGLKLPIHEMALAIQSINRSRDERDRIIFCVDGVHALGVEDFRVSELGCDFLAAGTHKWMFGPRGTGLVWGHPKAWPIARATIPTFSSQAYDLWMENKSSKDLPPSVHMTPGGFHSFEHRWALDEAFTFHQAIGKSRVTQRIYELNQQLKQGLIAMPHVTLHTPMSQDLSAGIVCFEVAGMSPRQVVERLRQRGIVGSVTPYATKYARLAPNLINSTAEIEKTLGEIRNLRVA